MLKFFYFKTNDIKKNWVPVYFFSVFIFNSNGQNVASELLRLNPD